MNISSESLLSLSRLRPPFARSGLVLFPYTNEGYVNPGLTVETILGEPVVAPGTGSVKKIYRALPGWQTTDPELKTTAVLHVEIDHGNKVSTLVGGLTTVNVVQGQTVYRGDTLGTLLTNQVFVSTYLANKTVNPYTVNRHWIPQNGSVIIGQGGKIRFAPDRVVRDLSQGVSVILNSGIKYFVNLVNPRMLVNVAFNGDGSKTGLAATGYTADDYWNVYTPSDFYATIAYSCYYYYYYPATFGFYEFSDYPVIQLYDYTNTLSPVILERIAPLFSAAGTAASWDDMLKAWVGGYLGMVPYENTFRLRNLPAGNYDLFLYANQGTFPTASTFYVSVGAGLPTSQSNNPIVTPVFVEGSNYVRFPLVVAANSYVTFKAVGYLSGLQLQRT